MAVGLAVTSEGGQYNGRVTLFVVLSCMVAATGGIIFSYDIGISGGVTSMEPFLKSQLLTSFTSFLYAAGLIASFFASPVTTAFLIGGAAFLTGAALGCAAYNVYMLIFGRVLLGVGVGFANQNHTSIIITHYYSTDLEALTTTLRDEEEERRYDKLKAGKKDKCF
ncbi:unnamed protein product [Ilex paraguariensis]|uniref:Major facilitator superfamily (MFS) profile domain-containing protein n=1 Tax=Ilex paraguariensis TaxID=185542 RepID=A0ABC8V3Y4_9AQUA